MDVSLAGPSHVADLAHLLWSNASTHERDQQPVESFATDLRAWWAERGRSHHAFIAREGMSPVIGMAWLALVARVPRPGITTRQSADIQSVFVLPDHRGQGVGAALVQAATHHAFHLGAAHVTVHSSTAAVPLYERLGFASSRDVLVTTDG